MKDNLKMRGEIEKLEGFNLYKEYCILGRNLKMLKLVDLSREDFKYRKIKL